VSTVLLMATTNGARIRLQTLPERLGTERGHGIWTGKHRKRMELRCTRTVSVGIRLGYNKPPICMKVEGSHDKKVEILLESDTENANLCIHDASDTSVDLNEVGSVSNCGTGKLYACFTAATAEDDSSQEDFGFYVFCNGAGCEQSDLTVRMRIRLSEQSWDDGKEDLTSDLEHWCEYERGTNIEDHVTTVVEGDEGYGQAYYQYPSDLLPDNPTQFPFHITHLGYSSAAGFVRPSIWLSLLAAMGLATVVFA